MIGHPDVAEVFASLDADVRVEPVTGPPYPMLRVVATPGGSIRRVPWIIEAELALEAWGDTDGKPGPEELRELVLVGAGALKELVDRDYAPWESVVTDVDASWPYPLDDPSGQPRWMCMVTMTCHPPVAPELAPEAADRAAPSEQAAYRATREDFVPRT